MASSCQVCCDPFTSVARCKVVCLFCNFESCVRCTKTYLLNLQNDAQCMSCHAIWNREFLVDNLAQGFVNGKLAAHRERLLFDREKALMPSMMPRVARYMEEKRLSRELFMTMTDLELARQHEDVEAERSIAARRTRLLRLFHQLFVPEEEVIKPMVARACPNAECRGFLSPEWKCFICNVDVCADCHAIKGADAHLCNKDDIKTAKLLAMDTKCCPSCGTGISKIDGCDQMYCTQCHTAFSWSTGKIERGKIHNPHYYEYLRNHQGFVPREEGDNPCDDIQGQHVYRLILKTIPDHQHVLFNVIRLYNHIRAISVPQLTQIVTNDDVRIRYLAKEISEECFRRAIVRNDKKNNKNAEDVQVFNMFVIVSHTIMTRLTGKKKVKDDTVLAVVAELQELARIFNDSLAKIARVYRLGAWNIDKDWELRYLAASKMRC